MIKTLAKKGFHIKTRFKAPGNLTGFVGKIPGNHWTIIYVTPDGKHALYGVLFNQKAQNLTASELSRFAPRPDYKNAFLRLKKADWIKEGAAHPKRIVYAFIDPNCPYCHQLWAAARHAYSKGLQIRYIIVAILGPSSKTKAAAILESQSPAKALDKNERRFASGGIKPIPHPSKGTRKILQRNLKLMARFDFDGTPGIVYHTTHQIQRIDGLPPSQAALNQVFGVRIPANGSHR